MACQPQSSTFSGTSNAHSTYMPETLFTQQQPRQPTAALREYIPTIPETQMIQPSQADQVV